MSMQTKSMNRLAPIDEAVKAAVRWLDAHQEPEGFWVGMIETNCCMEAEWLMASHILGIKLPMEDGLVRAILKGQRPDGAWETYPGATGGDINSTVESYVALRLKGLSPSDPVMTKARNWILQNGGLRKVRVFTRYWLAMLGIWPWQATPNVPPEVIRFPRWFPFNIYNFAQWARATFVPLTVISARRAVFPLPCGRLDELFPDGYENFDFYTPVKDADFLSLEWIFLKVDRILHALQNARLTPGRENAIKLCLEWVIKHQDADGAWGGIQPPWIYALIALHVEGYALDHPVLAKGISTLSDHWSYERDGVTHIQASESPVWDTLLALLAMHEAGSPLKSSPSMRKELDWVLQKQVDWPGDWSITVKNTVSGGWAFERANLYYPDIDDTAVALLMLGRIRGSAEPALRERIETAIERGVAWTLAMQSRSGGWGAFDKDNDKEIISKIPFCNFGEALDPPSADVTGHVLEALGALGFTKDHPAVAKGLAFLRAEQEEDGSWFGRWGVNHIYGTAAVLPALEAIGEDMGQDYVRRAADWLASKQNPDGGWGETCASYMDPKLRGTGPSTPSQTAWGLMSLLAVNSSDHAAPIRKGVDFLIKNQDESGTWDERYYTGTGFPGYGVGARMNLDAEGLSRKLGQGTELSRGFLLGYNMYRHSFPLLALGRAKHWLETAG